MRFPVAYILTVILTLSAISAFAQTPDQPIVKVQALQTVPSPRMQIRWSAVNGIDGYHLERKTGVLGTYSRIPLPIPNVTDFLDADTTLVYGGTYCYHVNSYAQTTESLFSNEICATMPPTPTFKIDVDTTTGTGTGTVSGAGFACPTDCSENINIGSAVTLTEAPTGDSVFTGWSGGGCSGNSTTCTVTAKAATVVIAKFDKPLYPLNINRTGAGATWGSVSSVNTPGIACPTDCAENYVSGQSVTLKAAATQGAAFTGWSGGGCTGTGDCVLSMTSAQNITANFAPPKYKISLTMSGNGLGTINAVTSAGSVSCAQSPCSFTYDKGTQVTLTGVQNAGSNFTTWSGGGCTGNGPCTVALNSDTSVDAQFSLPNFLLTVSNPNGTFGKITSSPIGIDCLPTCLKSFPNFQDVILTPAPAGGGRFLGWSGGGCTGLGSCTVHITADTTVSANFGPPLFNLSVTVDPAGNGSGKILSDVPGINCNPDCAELFQDNQTVVLTPFPDTGSKFLGWNGGGCTGTDPCTLTMTAAKSVSGTFGLKNFDLVLSPLGDGKGRVTSLPAGIDCGNGHTICKASFQYNKNIVLTEQHDTGTDFIGWGFPCSGSTTASCTVTVTADATVNATFKTQQLTLNITPPDQGKGMVTTSDLAINCPPKCDGTFPYNTTITLTETPLSNSVFVRWFGGSCDGQTGPTCALTMTSNFQVQAVFSAPTVLVSVANSGTGAGSVESIPDGINCDLPCNGNFPTNTSVTLIPHPKPGNKFLGWTGPCVGVGNCTFTTSGDVQIDAKFGKPTVLFAVNSGGDVYTSADGVNYLIDKKYTNKLKYGYRSGTKFVVQPPVPINNSPDSPLFMSGRRSTATFSYRFMVPNGHYRVWLRFAETEFDEADKRIFSVLLEKTIVADKIDLFALVGKNMEYSIAPEIDVNDGLLDIDFDSEKGRGVINAIVVISDDPVTPPPPPNINIACPPECAQPQENTGAEKEQEVEEPDEAEIQ